MTRLLHSWLGRLGLIVTILVSVIGCDQATKNLATETLELEAPIALFDNFVRFQYAENRGALLSLGANLPPVWRSLVFTLGVGAFLAAVFGFLLFKRGLALMQVIACSLALGGGLGNLLDRVVNQGSVVDFVSVGWGGFRTGIFNFADVMIFLGMGLLLWHSRQPEAQAARATSPD